MLCMLDPWSRHSCGKKLIATLCLLLPLSAGCKRGDEWAPASVTTGWIIMTLLRHTSEKPQPYVQLGLSQPYSRAGGLAQNPSSSASPAQAPPQCPRLSLGASALRCLGSLWSEPLGPACICHRSCLQCPLHLVPPSRTPKGLAGYEKCLYPNSALPSTREGKDGWMSMPIPQELLSQQSMGPVCPEIPIPQRNMGEPLPACWRWSEGRWFWYLLASARKISQLGWGNQCRPPPYLKWRVNSQPVEERYVWAGTASPHLWWVRHPRDSAGRWWKGEVGQSRQRHQGIHLPDQTDRETAAERVSDLLRGWYAEQSGEHSSSRGLVEGWHLMTGSWKSR